MNKVWYILCQEGCWEVALGESWNQLMHWFWKMSLGGWLSLPNCEHLTLGPLSSLPHSYHLTHPPLESLHPSLSLPTISTSTYLACFLNMVIILEHVKFISSARSWLCNMYPSFSSTHCPENEEKKQFVVHHSFIHCFLISCHLISQKLSLLQTEGQPCNRLCFLSTFLGFAAPMH